MTATPAQMAALLPGIEWRLGGSSVVIGGGAEGCLVSVVVSGRSVQVIGESGQYSRGTADTPEEVADLVRARLRVDRQRLARSIAAIDALLGGA